MAKELIVDFGDKNVSIGLSGGKGVNLAKLFQSGFQVPNGFIITTNFYNNFIEVNNLKEFISKKLSRINKTNYTILENISQEIRDGFEVKSASEDLFTEIFGKYKSIGSPHVAVRSSATAEDLEDLSFAGQHDTILNVKGEQQLKHAIITCLSSLWTARAIGYREQNSIPHENISLAVVVQEMVQSETSGVLFTANPLTGNRHQFVIDSTFGLGEALVSGMIEPDHYIINTFNGKVIEKRIGSKNFAIEGIKEGGIEEITKNENKESLSKKDIKLLLKLGEEVTNFYKSPQDIEWAFVNGELYLIQSRPITTLFPVSEEFLNGPKRVAFSFAAVQGFLDPMTPLGRETIMMILLGIPRTMGYTIDFSTQTVFFEMVERLWINISYPLKNRILKNRLIFATGGIDKGISLILKEVVEENYLKTEKRLNLKTGKIFTRLLLLMAKNIREYMIDPKGTREKNQDVVEEAIQRIKINIDNLKTLEQKIKYYFQILENLPSIIFIPIIPAVGAGYIPLFIANKLGKEVLGESDIILEFTRSLPNNPTTEMNLALARIANKIKKDTESLIIFQNDESETLVEKFQNRNLPKIALSLIKDFLDKYGARGFVEIDISRPRWHEDPLHVINAIKSIILMSDDHDPLKQNVIAIRSAYQSYNKLLLAIKNTKGGSLKSRIIQGGFKRTRELAGLREFPKFTIIRIFRMLKTLMIDIGDSLVNKGVIENQNDVFYLRHNDFRSILKEKDKNIKSLIKERKSRYNREKTRIKLPRIILSDGRTFYDVPSKININDRNIIMGSPVSPGTVKGKVRVVLDPTNADLQPGEILVCSATDPSWTPLFLVASGLIMEVGGMMQHGALVAREHNIPAIVGVNNVTSILKDGQIIRINGTSGIIKILE